MKLRNPFAAVFLTFYSLKFYDEIAKHWRKRIFLFILVFTFFIMIPLNIRFMINLNHYLLSTSDQLAASIPTVTIKNHQASVQDKKPKYIIFPGTDMKLALINTVSDHVDFAKDPAFIWIGKNHITAKGSQGKPAIYHYPKGPVVYTHATYKAYLHKGVKRVLVGAGVFLYVMSFVAFFIFYLVLGVIFSAFTRMIAAAVRYQVPYYASLMQAYAASVPALTVFALFYLFKLLSGFTVFISIIVLMIYLAVSVLAYEKNYRRREE